MAGPIADTRGNPFGYISPLTSTGTYSPVPSGGTAGEIIGESTGGAITNAPNLQKISGIVNALNQQAQQQANLGRVGGDPRYDQAILANILQQSQGYVSPETVREAEAGIAAQYGGAGFAPDTPAMQSAVRRAMGIRREDLQGKAAEQYAQFLQTHPAADVVDVSKYTMTPQEEAQRRYQQQQVALEQQRMTQQALEFAANQALKEREFRLSENIAKAKTGMDYGFDAQGNYVPGGRYQYGYYDPQGQFHGNARLGGI